MADSEWLVKEMIGKLGENANREGLVDTPKRVVKSWKHLYGGYNQDPKKILERQFEKADYDQMVVLRDIEIFSTCEHHMLPFFGKCHIAYLPGDRVVGLSKLARLVEVYSRRLQIQEKLTMQIADCLFEVLDPLGVGVVIEAKHFCMVARGVEKQNSVMSTSALLGKFREAEVRDEFMRMIGK